ncbi:hypothetical protein BU24DRAFT_468251 [Aaosphaeria arxii CBS 175.79]|uniref:Uncharacterized protein n=1 Tax=Aaosphaeria arxii CBS 175.79 TaxID=1450172 RepID=A0A6A5X8Q9_9PLEO|nr:uncharacterized protein BU24DRAFT_468251 [Aaosphaeria arxii CBS 175.79]KAF2009276.1 hypothetical protein BU24DRAFT_468251 [Aaosphaeria arxii CBS 175.79]
MSLIPLPLEILTACFYYLISDVGLEEIWNIRPTSKQFAQAIDYVVFASQPLKSFGRSERTERILRMNKVLYMSFRVNNPLDSLTIYYDQVRRTARTLARMSKQINPEEDERKLYKEFTWSFCERLAELKGFDVFEEASWARPTPATVAALSQDETVAAALTLSKPDVATRLLEAASVVYEGLIFGNPLTGAASHGCPVLVKTLLEKMDFTSCFKSDWFGMSEEMMEFKQRSGFVGGLGLAIKAGHVEVVQILTKWLKDCEVTFQTRNYGFFWLLDAVATRNETIVKELLAMKFCPRASFLRGLQFCCSIEYFNSQESTLKDPYARLPEIQVSPERIAIWNRYEAIIRCVIGLSENSPSDELLRPLGCRALEDALKGEHDEDIDFVLKLGVETGLWDVSSAEMLRGLLHSPLEDGNQSVAKRLNQALQDADSQAKGGA